VISPTKSKQTSHSKPLNIEDFKDQKVLELCITASYIQGNDITEIISKTKMNPDEKRWVRKAVDGLIGVEIAEDFADRLVLQNLIDPTKFDLNELLIKFAETSKAVFQDSIRALETLDLSLAQDAFERGEQSIKVYRLLMRLAILASKSKNVREQMKLQDISSVIIKIIAIRELGRMAYYAMRIAQHVAEIDKRLEEPIISTIHKLTKIAVEMQAQSLDALMKKDLVAASSLVDRMVQVRKLYETAYHMIPRHNERTSFAVSLIIRDIRAFAGYAVALADDAVLGVFEI
jgi:phosphate uptake regulator